MLTRRPQPKTAAPRAPAASCPSCGFDLAAAPASAARSTDELARDEDEDEDDEGAVAPGAPMFWISGSPAPEFGGLAGLLKKATSLHRD